MSRTPGLGRRLGLCTVFLGKTLHSSPTLPLSTYCRCTDGHHVNLILDAIPATDLHPIPLLLNFAPVGLKLLKI